MANERSALLTERSPQTYLYPLCITVLLVGTVAALAVGQDLLGTVGVVALSVVSLAYGAMQRPEEF